MGDILILSIGVIIGILLSVGLIFISNRNVGLKRKVPITYKLDWWPHQHQLEVEKLTVEVISGQLNLFNSRSVIAYTIKGKLLSGRHGKPYIKKVHVSERLINQSPLHGAEVDILLTPVVKEKEDKSSPGGTVEFAFTNKHLLPSMSWGENRFRIICGDHEENVVFLQSK